MRTWSKGETIGQRYRLVAEIGSGGMGQVFHAEHLTLGCDVAVKVLRPAADKAVDARGARFEREARTAASLRGPHVVQVLDHGIDDGTPYIVMERLRGQSLRQRMDAVGRLAPIELARVLVHVSRALERAHARGIVHRDLKPENVFVVDDEHGETVKVLDFGIAKVDERLASKGRVTESGAILGTPLYMSPEQLRGRDVDGQADLWSLAVIAFEAICGRPPFDGESLADLIINISTGPTPVPSSVAVVPDGFDDWFARGTRRAPSERFCSARELAEAYVCLLPEVPNDLCVWPPEPDSDTHPDDLPFHEHHSPPQALLERETLAEPVTEDRGRAGRPSAPPIPGDKTHTWLWLALTLMPIVAAVTVLRQRATGNAPTNDEPDAPRVVASATAVAPAVPQPGLDPAASSVAPAPVTGVQSGPAATTTSASVTPPLKVRRAPGLATSNTTAQPNEIQRELAF